jgi:hypothetical protein
MNPILQRHIHKRRIGSVRASGIIIGFVMLIVSAASAQRTVEKKLLRASNLPAIRIRVSPEFSYIGSFNFKVGDVGSGEAYLYRESQQSNLQRVVLIDFEHFFPQNDHTYEYPRLDMVRLGDEEYLHQTWASKRGLSSGTVILAVQAVVFVVSTTSLAPAPSRCIYFVGLPAE